MRTTPTAATYLNPVNKERGFSVKRTLTELSDRTLELVPIGRPEFFTRVFPNFGVLSVDWSVSPGRGLLYINKLVYNVAPRDALWLSEQAQAAVAMMSITEGAAHRLDTCKLCTDGKVYVLTVPDSNAEEG